MKLNNYDFERLGKQIYIFNEIEKFLNFIITHHIKPQDELFFINYVLNTHVISSGAKLKILSNLKIFSENEIEDIRTLMTNRNVFAHNNKTEDINIEVTHEPETVKINISEVIIQTNSNGKLKAQPLSEFIIENNNKQKTIIDFISNYVKDNNINTHYSHIENFISLKNYL